MSEFVSLKFTFSKFYTKCLSVFQKKITKTIGTTIEPENKLKVNTGKGISIGTENNVDVNTGKGISIGVEKNDLNININNALSIDNTNNLNVNNKDGIITDKDNNLILDKTYLLNLVYPVGSLYWSSKNVSPQTFLGGKWASISGKFVLAAGSGYSINTTGGSSTKQLSVDELPTHFHVYTPSGSISDHNHTLNKGNTSDSGTTTTAGVRNEAHSHTYTLRGYNNQSWLHDGSFVSKSSNNYVTDGSSTSTSSTTTQSYIYGETDKASLSFTGTKNTTTPVGNNSPFSIMPPYVTKYCWERIE